MRQLRTLLQFQNNCDTIAACRARAGLAQSTNLER